MNEFSRQNTQGAGPADMTLRDLLTPLFRRKRLLGVSFLGLAVLAVLATLFLSSSYKCRMEILVNRERVDPSVTSETTAQGPLTQLPLTDEEINSEAELLVSPDLLREVVLANNLQEREKKSLIASILPLQDENWYVSKAVDHLAKGLNIEVVKKTSEFFASKGIESPRLNAELLVGHALGLPRMRLYLEFERPVGDGELGAVRELVRRRGRRERQRQYQ